MKTSALALACIAAALPLHPAEAACSAKAEAPAIVIELFTSEGCSSCPPADRWLTGLPAQIDGRPLVPLAFHVDYWDSLGWRDRFADPRFDMRQDEAVRRNGGRTAYTPQVFVGGRPGDDWRSGHIAAPKAANLPRLSLSAMPVAGGWQVAANGSMPTGVAGRLWIGLVESGLSSSVKAGENSGATLQHAHVVRAWQGPQSLPAGGAIDWKTKLALPADSRPANSRFVAVVEDATGRPLQALELPVCTGAS